MKIFLSWSGHKSNLIAKELKLWLKSILNEVVPFFSTQDMTKGNRWAIELAKQLEDTEYGIVLMTKENTNSPWLFFEAGALSKNFLLGKVTTILFDITDSEVNAPLSQFQNTKFEKDDMYKLIVDLNRLAKKSITEKKLQTLFNQSWNQLQVSIKKILRNETDYYENTKSLIDKICSSDCTRNKLKKWAIDNILLLRTIEKINSISSNHLQLHAYDTLDYIAFQYEMFLEHLRPGDEYYAISTMRFFSKNKIKGGTRGYFKYNIHACVNGANINRIIFAAKQKINPKGGDDYSELIHEIANHNAVLKSKKAKGKSINEVKVVTDYQNQVDKHPGFGLIKRNNEYILIVPENVKASGEKPRIQIYFSDGKGDIFRKYIRPCIESFEEAKRIKSIKL